MTDIREAARRYGVIDCALPGWDEGADFQCRLRRPGLVNMACAAGFIPNPLLSAVEALFFPSGSPAKLPPDQQAKALNAIARYALVEPTFEQLREAGLELTDEQYMAIYAFALKGAEGLSRFRQQLRGNPHGDGDGVPHAAVEADPASGPL
jgi:hypothetical protein